jgi:hypothetical protein
MVGGGVAPLVAGETRKSFIEAVAISSKPAVGPSILAGKPPYQDV